MKASIIAVALLGMVALAAAEVRLNLCQRMAALEACGRHARPPCNQGQQASSGLHRTPSRTPAPSLTQHSVQACDATT